MQVTNHLIEKSNYRREPLSHPLPTILCLAPPHILFIDLSILPPVLSGFHVVFYLQSCVRCSISYRCFGQDFGTTWWPLHRHSRTGNIQRIHTRKLYCEIESNQDNTVILFTQVQTCQVDVNGHLTCVFNFVGMDGDYFWNGATTLVWMEIFFFFFLNPKTSCVFVSLVWVFISTEGAESAMLKKNVFLQKPRTDKPNTGLNTFAFLEGEPGHVQSAALLLDVTKSYTLNL